MQKQRMIRMLEDARSAVNAADLFSTLVQPTSGEDILAVTEGTQNLIGQLILASAIEESGSSISLSLDKLDKLALELGAVSAAIAISG
ncbi:hypothetical protein LCGC14_2018180 [marine sediment metagenome]|uniref:Uncharacterized protein n=1 Tax=marine sediment metagenome TaxID=412755 RepID=A0A0F9HVF4_9ZZZZ